MEGEQSVSIVILQVDWDVCQYNSGLTNCEHHCDKDPDMVCGTDGRTYINHCYLMVENCLKGVELSHYGPCSNGTEPCPASCQELRGTVRCVGVTAMSTPTPA